MNTIAISREKCTSCGAPIRWATTVATGSAIPLNPSPVPAGTKGALVLIGELAFGFIDAVQRLAGMFEVDEPAAAVIANEDYPWHLAHFATCPERRRR